MWFWFSDAFFDLERSHRPSSSGPLKPVCSLSAFVVQPGHRLSLSLGPRYAPLEFTQ